MVVCHCECITDKEINKLDCKNLCELQENCPAGKRCGGCIPLIEELIEYKKQETTEETR